MAGAAAENADAWRTRASALMLAPWKFPRSGEISLECVFKSPLGHPEWWYITLFRALLEHAHGPADACGLPTALTGPTSRGRQP